MKFLLFFCSKDSTNFWKSWNKKYRHKVPPVPSIDGCSDSSSIADVFKRFYSNVFIDSSSDRKAAAEFAEVFLRLDKLDKSIPDANIEIIERCIKGLKLNKAAGYDGIVTEHIIHSHPSLVVHIKLLFTMIMRHCYVPEGFGLGVIIPIAKDTRGDLTSSDNYRPITLSSIFSKLFESFLLENYSPLLPSDNLQFGFKKKVGCAQPISVLRQIIEYFNNRDSNVYVASIDASKAFDRVNHYKLFSILISKGLPYVFICTIINWYNKLFVTVKWNDSYSDSWKVDSGVRQGGILSPILFNFYVNSIIVSLRELDLGCHLHGLFLGCIMYADDLLLLSASVQALQLMLDRCGVVGSELGITFNVSKSCCIAIGPIPFVSVNAKMTLCNMPISWQCKCKYLGVTLLSGKHFNIDLSEIRRKFFVSCNLILSKCSYVSEPAKLKLVEAHCLPILLYAIESLNLSRVDLAEINSWWNSVYRKIFNFNKWESVKQLICLLGRLDVLHLENIRRIHFIKKMLASCTGVNNTVKFILTKYIPNGEFTFVLKKFDSQFDWSLMKIKAMSFNSFKAIATA